MISNYQPRDEVFNDYHYTNQEYANVLKECYAHSGIKFNEMVVVDCEYQGNFKQGKRDGNGTFTFVDGRKYKGDFVDGEFSGKGTFFETNGTVYEGDFLNGKLHGNCTVTFPDCRKQSFIFENGKAIEIISQ